MEGGMEGEIKKTLDKVWIEWPWEKAFPREQLFKHAAAEINKLFEEGKVDAKEERLSKPISWTEEYQWAILQELRAIRQILESAYDMKAGMVKSDSRPETDTTWGGEEENNG